MGEQHNYSKGFNAVAYPKLSKTWVFKCTKCKAEQILHQSHYSPVKCPECNQFMSKDRLATKEDINA